MPARASTREALGFIARQHQQLETGAGCSFCVADLVDDKAHSRSVDRRLGEGPSDRGYTVAPSPMHRGVAVKALRALTAFAWTLSELFGSSCTSSLGTELYVEPWNAASIRVAEAAE